MGITFSITIPEPLEKKLKQRAMEKEVSRSRFIGEILSRWEDMQDIPKNKCLYNDQGFCRKLNIFCKAPQYEAETCTDYCSR